MKNNIFFLSLILLFSGSIPLNINADDGPTILDSKISKKLNKEYNEQRFEKDQETIKTCINRLWLQKALDSLDQYHINNNKNK